MQLQAVTPEVLVPGFQLQVQKNDQPIVQDDQYETLFIDYYLEVTAICTGDNPLYGTPGQVSFIISQFTDKCDIGVKTDSPDQCLLIVLEVSQILKAIRVVECQMGDHKRVFLMVSVTDTIRDSTTTFAWTLRQAIAG